MALSNKENARVAITCEELNQGGCGSPGCTHDHTVLYLHARCHPSAGGRVSYDKRTGNIRIVCRRCEDLIAEIAVARSSADVKQRLN